MCGGRVHVRTAANLGQGSTCVGPIGNFAKDISRRRGKSGAAVAKGSVWVYRAPRSNSNVLGL